MARAKGTLNLMDQPIYDRQSIAAATTELQFFQTPISSTVSKLLTNMTQVGRLPEPQTHLTKRIRLVPVTTNVLADLKLIMDGVYIELEMFDKNMFTLPFITVPAGCGIAGATTLTNANGVPEYHNAFVLSEPLFIDKGEQFKIYMKIPTALGAISATTPVYCFMDGLMTKGVL